MSPADLLDWTLHRAMSGMPTTWCSTLGARLAPAMGKRTNPADHARALRLIERLRPDWAARPDGAEAAADRLWSNIGRTFAEFAVSHRMLRQGRLSTDGIERLDAAAATGRPIVAIFPHLGNWELSEMQVGFRLPHRVAVIVAPPVSRARAAIAFEVRRKVPLAMLPMSRMVWRQALAALRTPGGCLMIAIDEKAKGRVWGPSLGRPCEVEGNLGKAVRLALTTKAIVVPFYNERLPGARFITHVLPPLELDGAANDPRAVAAGVQRLDAVMTEPIVRLLDQWFMALSFAS